VDCRVESTAATPLMMAAKGGAEDSVRLLLEAGADANARANDQVRRRAPGGPWPADRMPAARKPTRPRAASRDSLRAASSDGFRSAAGFPDVGALYCGPERARAAIGCDVIFTPPLSVLHGESQSIK
jgi:hypothetical protein